MSDDVMQAVVEKGLADVDICTFGFQGGEPLLAGLGFFQKFVEEVGRLKNQIRKYCLRYRRTVGVWMSVGQTFSKT